jgi:membrane fusion protein, multidrug efflux system
MSPEQNRDDAIHVPGPKAAAAPSSADQAVKTSAPRPDGGPAPSVAAPAAGSSPRKKAILAGLGVVALAAIGYFGIPLVLLALNTVSTDDAYVNSHVTFVAARVSGQVAEDGVLTDDNKPVTKGMPIVLLDPEPFQKEVDRKEADLAKAKADYVDAGAKVRTMVAQARNSRFKLEHAMDNLNADVKQLRGTVFSLSGDLAKRDDARKVFARYNELMKTPGATTPQELDSKERDFLVAKAKVEQTLQTIYQIRQGFGLSTKRVDADKITTAPEWLGDTPDDLDQTAPAIRQAVAEVMEAVAPLGVTPSSFDLPPKQLLEEFLKRDPDPNGDPKGKLDRIYQIVIKEAPAIAQAKAKIAQAEADLAVAKLNLSYCVVRAEIDGVVTRRNVNPGNNVKAGQSLMAIRSLTEIWIDANFKETQLAELRIGQPVKIEVDMYGSRQEFDGRITGFTMGTGQTLALLPPQNATGNFVKIVQRLPVKVELFDYDPKKTETPLFVGLSATPYVYIRRPLVGNDPDKGKFLQTVQPGRGKS